LDALIYDFVLIAGASVFIAIFAQIAIHVPLSPVPITGQTFAVLLVGLLIGKNRGLLAVMAYLFEGVCGLPVFANATFGPAHLLGPTGGYLIGFLPAVYVTGLIAENNVHEKISMYTVALIVGTVIIFASGLSWLKHYVGADNVLELGFYPFVPGAIFKVFLTIIIIPGLKRILKGHL
jgi:biotin transport system substrate-specific component